MQKYTDFGLKARAIMLEKRITMTQIAKHVGVSAPYISDIFRGGRKGLAQRAKIADFLGMEGEESNGVSD